MLSDMVYILMRTTLVATFAALVLLSDWTFKNRKLLRNLEGSVVGKCLLSRYIMYCNVCNNGVLSISKFDKLLLYFEGKLHQPKLVFVPVFYTGPARIHRKEENWSMIRKTGFSGSLRMKMASNFTENTENGSKGNGDRSSTNCAGEI